MKSLIVSEAAEYNAATNMKSLIISDAAEYNAATERISSALQTLRDGMKTLRRQDVTLMRQFITMNDTIRTMCKDKRNDNRHKKRQRNRTRVIATLVNQNTTTPDWQIPLVRQQSVPRFCDVIPERTWSGSSNDLSDCSQDESSVESEASLDEDSVASDDGDVITNAVPVFRPAFVRQRSRSMKTPKSKVSTSENESKLEFILKNNVKLWKSRQESGFDNDSVFESDGSDGEEKC